MLKINTAKPSGWTSTKGLLIAVLLVMGAAIFMPHQTYAISSPFPNASDGYSGNNNCRGTAAGNFNLVIFVRILNWDGSVNHYSGSFDFNIDSYNKFKYNGKARRDLSAANKIEWDEYVNNKGNALLYRNNGSAWSEGPGPQTRYVRVVNPGGSYSSQIFSSGQGNACVAGGDGYQPAYAFRDGDNTDLNCWPNWPSSTSKSGCGTPGTNRSDHYNNQSWLLSCLASDATAYFIYGVTVHDAGAGSWVGATVSGSNNVNSPAVDGVNSVRLQSSGGAELNTNGATVTFDYRLSAPPPPPANITPYTSMTPGGNIEPTQSYSAGASLVDSTSTGTNVTASRRTWLDNGDQAFGAGDSLNSDTSGTVAVGGNSTYNYGAVGGTAATPFQYVCTELYNISVPAGVVLNAGVRKTCVPIVKKPYLAAYGADVVAGLYSQDGESCVAQTAGVISWNHDGTTPYASSDFRGAGATAAVFASGNIGHFSSGLNITNLKPTGLSFANTTTSGTTYGGQFAGSPPADCDFTAGNDKATPLPINPLTNSYSSPFFSGKKYFTATGDVYINSLGVHYASTSWLGLNQIPSFKLIVTGGNIYIDKDATRLDGLYVAIPSGGTGGEIFTCAEKDISGNFTRVDNTTAAYQIKCDNQLKIFGAFAAKRIHFDRTYGTAHRTNQTGAANDWTVDEAAERFVYSPEMWLPNGSADNNDFPNEYYQGLPPVL